MWDAAEDGFCDNCDNRATVRLSQTETLLCDTCYSAFTWGETHAEKKDENNVVIRWTPDDVLSIRPYMTTDEAVEALSGCSDSLQEISIERGWDVLESIGLESDENVPCSLHSVWDGGVEVTAAAVFSPREGKVTACEFAYVDGLDILERQFVRFENGVEYDLDDDLNIILETRKE